VFPLNVLEGINRNFNWNFIPAKGTAGGILLGCKPSVLEVLCWQGFNFCSVALVKNQGDKMVWKLIVVYGSPYEETKRDFIAELHMVMDGWFGPTLVGGGFNLVRNQSEKNNGLVNFSLTSSFNDWIEKWGMLLISDPCKLYTWSNNQRCPVMAKLDRVLVSVDWENKNPLAKVTVLPKGVSDHSPVLIDFGGGIQQKDHMFRFEKWWLEIDGFTEMVSKTWETTCPHSDPLEIWQFKIRLLRKKIRGGIGM
jgi:hypothetical protein